jgi:hypothetical protein
MTTGKEKEPGTKRKESAMTDKKAYVKKIEQQLQDWQDDIFKFRVIAEAEERELDHQIKEYQIIEDIHEKIKAVAEKLDTLKEAGTEQWAEIRNEIDDLSQQVVEAISSARTKVN